MSLGKNIDELFKSKLKERTFEYNDAHWAAAQKMLNNRKKKFWLIGYVANSKLLGFTLACLCISAAALPLLFSTSNGSLPANASKFNQNQQNGLSDLSQQTVPKGNQTIFANKHPNERYSKDRNNGANENNDPNNSTQETDNDGDKYPNSSPKNQDPIYTKFNSTSKREIPDDSQLAPSVISQPINQQSNEHKDLSFGEKTTHKATLSETHIDNQDDLKPPKITGGNNSTERLLSTSNLAITKANQQAQAKQRNSDDPTFQEQGNFISIRETKPILKSGSSSYKLLKPISFPTLPSPKSGAIWTLGFNAHYNLNQRHLISGKKASNPYLAERISAEQLHNGYGFGLQISRLSNILNWQIGLDFGQYSQSLNYTSQATFRTFETRTELLDRKYGEYGEPIYLFETKTDTIDSVVTYQQISEHKKNTIRFFEIPVFVGYHLPLRSKRLILDVGIGASWQRAFGLSGFVINNKRDDLISLDNFLNRNALYAIYGINCQYRIGRSWYTGISARYKTSIGSFRFDDDFSLQQYQIRFSITKAIF